MLAEVARHADHLLSQRDHPLQMRIAHIHACFLNMLFRDLAAVTAPDRARERTGHIVGKPHHLAHFADRHAGAIVNHRRCETSTVAAIFLVDVLDHLFAPFVLEIDVDIGRLFSFFRDETVEQQLMFRRIDRGYLQAVTNCRVRR